MFERPGRKLYNTAGIGRIRIGGAEEAGFNKRITPHMLRRFFQIIIIGTVY